MPSPELPRCPQCGSGDIQEYDAGLAVCITCGRHFPENVVPEVHHVHDDDSGQAGDALA